MQIARISLEAETVTSMCIADRIPFQRAGSNIVEYKRVILLAAMTLLDKIGSGIAINAVEIIQKEESMQDGRSANYLFSSKYYKVSFSK